MAVYINQDIGKFDGIIDGITLEDVIRMVNSDKNAPQIDVWIETNGGDVQEAKDIYAYLKSLNKPINTYANGNVDSAGVIILLAGDKRIGFKGKSTSLIHATMPVLDMGVYQSDDLINIGESSKSLTDEMVKFYSSITGQTKEAFAPLVRDETELNENQMKDLGFLTEIRDSQIRAVAFKSNKNSMSKELIEAQKEATKEIKSFGEMMRSFFNKHTRNVNIKLQDATGVEIDFYDREDGSPEIGDKANVDGSAAVGEYTMPDGEVFKFEAGVLTEIIAAAEENEEMAALKTENEALKAEIETLKTSNLALKDESESNVKAIKEVQSKFAAFEKKMVTNFNIKLENERKPEDEGKPKSRRMFKDKN